MASPGYEPVGDGGLSAGLMDSDSEEYKKMERRIVRKQDWHIMPLICFSYLLNYIDRTNLANALVLNLDRPEENIAQVLELTGNRFSFVVAIFFLPYVFFELPSNVMLTLVTPSKWIARIMISWSIVTIITAAVSSYGGLVACRIALGICEAGYFPGIMLFLCYWYPPSERALRMSIFSASVSVAGAFGGLIATGVSFLSGFAGLYGYQWLFVLEGIPAFIVGVVILYKLPDFPETATFLTPEEREFAAIRMGPLAPKMSDKHLDLQQALSCLSSPIFWTFAVAYFCLNVSANAFGYFAPSIIFGMGFEGALGQALTIPPNIVAFFIVIGNCWHSDRSRERPLHVAAGCGVVMTGWLLLALSENWIVRYFAVCLIAATSAAVIPLVAFSTAVFSGTGSTAVATGGVVAFSNISGAVSPYLFPKQSAPYYTGGMTACFTLDLVALVLVLGLRRVLGSSSEYRGKVAAVDDGEDDELIAAQDRKRVGVARTTVAEAVDDL